jgi:hypothetical protein
VSYPRRGGKDLYLVTIRGYLHYLCGEVRDDFTETVKSICGFLKVREIRVANNRSELNGEEHHECLDIYQDLDEDTSGYPPVPRVLAKILQKMQEFKRLKEEMARLEAEDQARIDNLWEDDDNEWDDVEELEAELEILEELEDEESSNATIILTPDESDTDEYMTALEVQLPVSPVCDANQLRSSQVCCQKGYWTLG